VAGGITSAVGFTNPLVGRGNFVPQRRRRRWWSLWGSTNREKLFASAFPISPCVSGIWHGLGSYWKWCYGLRVYPEVSPRQLARLSLVAAFQKVYAARCRSLPQHAWPCSQQVRLAPTDVGCGHCSRAPIYLNPNAPPALLGWGDTPASTSSHQAVTAARRAGRGALFLADTAGTRGLRSPAARGTAAQEQSTTDRAGQYVRPYVPASPPLVRARVCHLTRGLGS
jgi:hypothetical protein